MKELPTSYEQTQNKAQEIGDGLPMPLLHLDSVRPDALPLYKEVATSITEANLGVFQVEEQQPLTEPVFSNNLDAQDLFIPIKIKGQGDVNLLIGFVRILNSIRLQMVKERKAPHEIRNTLAEHLEIRISNAQKEQKRLLASSF